MTDDIQQHRKDKFWEQARQSVERLRADPVAWKHYQDEIALWDSLAGDGLADEEPYYTPEEEAQIEAEYARAYGDRPPEPGNRAATEGVRGLS